jgi:hypothetical protein
MREQVPRCQCRRAEFSKDSLQELEAEAIVSRPATTWKMKQRKIFVPNAHLRLLGEDSLNSEK